jgi:hypothetical protein
MVNILAVSVQTWCVLIQKGWKIQQQVIYRLLAGLGDRYIQLFDKPVQAAAIDAE